jgi:acyl-CoA synthetase (AMP-forming)/AMP-acid ligase II
VRLPLVVPHVHQQQLRTRMANPATSDLTTMEMVGSVLALVIGFGGIVLVMLLLVGGFTLLDRVEKRPHELQKKWRRELDEMRRRLTRLEEGGRDLAQMEERLAFVEQLLDEPRTPLPPGREGKQ